MIFLSFYLYKTQNNKLQTSLVPYENLNELKLNERIFEINEKEVIISSILEAKKTESWGSQEFLNKAKEMFLSECSKQENDYLFDFISQDLVFQGKKTTKADFNDLNFKKTFLSVSYSFAFVDINNEKYINITRIFDKTFRLSGDKSKINFVIDVYSKLKKEYILNEAEVI